MRKMTPKLDAVLTELGATEDVKTQLVGFLTNQAASVAGQIVGLRANAENATRQADEMAEEALRLTGMLEALTVEVSETADVGSGEGE